MVVCVVSAAVTLQANCEAPVPSSTETASAAVLGEKFAPVMVRLPPVAALTPVLPVTAVMVGALKETVSCTGCAATVTAEPPESA